MAVLHEYLTHSARRIPDRVAIEDPGVAVITYGDLDRASDRVRDRLRALGVRPGDRVGLALRKSIDAVAAIFGIQKCGAAHVPVDASGPVDRAVTIFENCAVAAVISESRLADPLASGMSARRVAMIPLDFDAGPLPLLRALDSADERRAAASAPAPNADRGPDDLAYILYTSGSTGVPKGVMVSQRATTAFVDWCSREFEPREDDRFSSHAPFHFDLSVLDVYVPIKHGATLVLISESNGKEPLTLAELVERERITCWYSTPSILTFLAQFGRLDRRDWSRVRIIHFAGEVFALKHLRALKELVPHPRYFNLYGPTETNVCTFYEVPERIPDDRTAPFPIGKPCAHYRHRVVDADGRDVARGEEGELWIHGPGVMSGYWNGPDRDAAVFREDGEGRRWYRTGDVVVEPPDGNLVFVGRRDRMVKKRGYRIELGEIESALYRHPEIREAAVVAVRDADDAVRIRAFLSARDGKLSPIQLKSFCARHLLDYMIPDQFTVLDRLPKTSTDKIDYQALKERA